jgi:predicted amidohydrolase
LVKVAVAQAHLQVGDVPGNILETVRLINEASKQGAQIVVLPELSNTGYVFNSIDELKNMLKNDNCLEIWQKESKEKQIIIVAGFAQEINNKFYNQSVIIEDGEIKTIYSKIHLFNTEKDYFEEGNKNPEIVNTKYGKLSTIICYDLEIPELVRFVADKGCELLCVPLNWPTGSFKKPEKESRPMELIKAMSMAATFRIWIALSDRCGLERNIEWLQSSSIIDIDGWPIAQVGEGSGVKVSEIDLNLAKDKTVSPKNHALGDFKRNLYQN